MKNQDSYYKNSYSNVFNVGEIGLVSNLIYKSMEIGLSHRSFENVIELEAGIGQHLEHV